MGNRDVEEKLRKLAPLDARSAEGAWHLFLSGIGSERDEAEDLLDVLLYRTARKGYARAALLDPPPSHDCDGEFRLGVVQYPPGTPYAFFGLREREWTSHVLIVGMTGAGKTTLAAHALRELHRHRRPFLVFDWKRSYRDLRQLPDLRDLTVLTVGRDVAPFFFNPLVPPDGMLPGEWLMKLVDVLKHAYFVGEGVEYLLRRGLDVAYEQSGWHAGKPTRTPTFQEVRTFVLAQRLQGRMSLWKASALRVLESLCFRHGLGPVVNQETPHNFAALLERDVVLELDPLADADKVFLTEALILWLFEHRKREPRRDTFKHALLIEEAHHILSEHKERTAGTETVMETCLRQIREFGEAVIVVDQEPSKLSHSIKANTHTKIVFTLGDGRDIDDIAKSLGLSTDERNYLQLLRVGEAIVSVKERLPTPALVRFPNVKIARGRVSDVAMGDRNVI